ncbi:uncharacterized protein LOC117145246 [Drosophila mauritiana]|uniref:Uncharacterized protein LOC117145246 n=1 Tax=Drosophila mauritiana TaxID=7226 RepID=A0A6P8KS11_DROMA|nr:uncharacterized protein LOC117145246 [Drosophila mauritiana]
MFGNCKLAATFRPLGRLRWLMEGSWSGYQGVALSAKRSLIGLHYKHYWKLFVRILDTIKLNCTQCGQGELVENGTSGRKLRVLAAFSHCRPIEIMTIPAME